MDFKDHESTLAKECFFSFWDFVLDLDFISEKKRKL